MRECYNGRTLFSVLLTLAVHFDVGEYLYHVDALVY